MTQVTLTVKRRLDSLTHWRHAQIDEGTRKKLDVSINDTIGIRGKKNTVGIVQESPLIDDGMGLIRIDSYIRKSADVDEGDRVKVRPVNVTEARKIVLAPIGLRLNVDSDFISFVKGRVLINRPFYEGNQLVLQVSDRQIPFELVETKPKRRAIIVVPLTSVAILNEPVEGTLELSKSAAEGAILGDRYELKVLLGRGNYGEVWKARDTSMERDVAVKLLHAGKKDLIQLKREGMALSGLSHKNIVNAYDLGSDGTRGWLVTECIDGGSLQEHLSRFVSNNQWITIERAVVIVERCLEALVYSHEKKRVHGDIKPGNILVSKTGEIKLSDFGVAKILGKKRSDETSYPPDYERLLGSLTYSAPEVLEGQPRDFQSDLFSLGILAYVLLSGKHPFIHSSGISSVPELIRSETYAPPKLREFRNDIPESYERIIHRLLEKNRKRRYETAQQVLDAWRTVKIVAKCPRCKTDNSVSNNYCGKCGNKLVEELP